jgi:predicted Zn-dependent protease
MRQERILPASAHGSGKAIGIGGQLTLMRILVRFGNIQKKHMDNIYKVYAAEL